MSNSHLPSTGLAAVLPSLVESLARHFGRSPASLQVSVLHQGVSADSTTALLVGAPGAPRLGVVICANADHPDAVEQAMGNARMAAEAVGPALARHVIAPLAEGRAAGASWALLPYCQPLAKQGLLWWLQRRAAAGGAAAWLRAVAVATRQAVPEEAVFERFDTPLAQLAGSSLVGDDVRRAGARALERLRSGAWRPQHVLMHGDLSRGNLLFDFSHAGPWSRRIMLIDWGGARREGYAAFDLLRLATAFRMPTAALRRELVAYAEALQCRPADLSGHLCAALGHLHLDLQHFPVHNFVRMAHSSLALLQAALPPRHAGAPGFDQSFASSRSAQLT